MLSGAIIAFKDTQGTINSAVCMPLEGRPDCVYSLLNTLQAENLLTTPSEAIHNFTELYEKLLAFGLMGPFGTRIVYEEQPFETEEKGKQLIRVWNCSSLSDLEKLVELTSVQHGAYLVNLNTSGSFSVARYLNISTSTITSSGERTFSQSYRWATPEENQEESKQSSEPLGGLRCELLFLAQTTKETMRGILAAKGLISSKLAFADDINKLNDRIWALGYSDGERKLVAELVAKNSNVYDMVESGDITTREDLGDLITSVSSVAVKKCRRL